MADDMHPALLQLQDKAWDLKDLCDDLAPRKLSAADVAALESVHRDLCRLEGKLVGVRDKRKRSKDDDIDTPAGPVSPATLALPAPEDDGRSDCTECNGEGGCYLHPART